MPPLWLALNLTQNYSTRAFGGDYDDFTFDNQDFKGWLFDVVVWTYLFRVADLTTAWIYASSMASVFFLCLFRRRSQVMKDFRAHREEALKSWVRWRVPWTFAKCAWYVPATICPINQVQPI